MIVRARIPEPAGEALLDDLLDGLETAITCYDALGRLVHWNDAARRLFPNAASTLRTGTLKAERDRAMAEGGYLSEREAGRLGALTTDVEEFDLPDGRRLRRQGRRTPAGRYALCHEELPRATAEAERRVLASFESLPFDYKIYDRELKLVRANQKHTRAIGPAAADVLAVGTSIEDHIRYFWRHLSREKLSEDSLEALVRRRVASLRATPNESFEAELADGRCVRIVTAPTPDGGLIRIDLDITALRSAERQLRGLLAALPIGVALINSSGRVEDVNNAYMQLHGKRSLEEARALDIAAAIRKNARSYVLNHADGSEYTPAERERWIEARIAATADGKLEPIETRTAGGRIVRITSARTPEGTIVQAHQDISDLIHELSDPSLIIGQAASVRARTRAAAFILEHPDGTPYSKDERASWLEGRIARVKSGIPEPVEVRTKSGRVVRITSARATDGTLVQVHQDISDLRSAQRRLQEVFEILPVGVIICDRDHNTQDANDAVREMFAGSEGRGLSGPALDEQIRTGIVEYLVTKPDGSRLTEAEMQAWRQARSVALGSGLPEPVEVRTNMGRTVKITSAKAADGRLIQVYEDTTELRRTEQRLTDAIESMDSTFILYDAEDRLQLWNQAASQLYSRMASAFRKGASYRSINAAGVAAGYVAASSQLAADPRATGSYVRHEPDGRQVLVRRARTREGGALIMHTDVTATRRAEARLVAAINAATEGFALFDKDDRLVACNDGYRWELVSIAERVAAGVSIEDIWSWSWDAGLVSSDDATSKEEWLESRRLRHRKSNQATFEVRRGKHVLRVNEYVTRDGELVRVSTDITELRTKEQALEKSLRQIELLSEAELARRTFLLQSVLDTVPDGLVVLDEANRATFWNHGFLRLAGWDDDSDSWSEGFIRGQKVESLLAQLTLPRTQMLRLLAEGAEQLEQTLNDGRHLSFKLLDARGGNRVLWISDQSLRRREEADRLAIQERLLQAQKSEAIGTMAGTIAHDFNNLLSIVLGFASLSDGQLDVLTQLTQPLSSMEVALRLKLGQAAEATREAKKGLNRIMEAANRAREIVTGLNTFAKTKPSDLVTKDLADTVRSAAQLIGIALPAAVSFEVATDGTSHLVQHDASKIEQVLVNLCLNAAHALENRPGTIELKLEHLDVDGGRAEALKRTERELHAQGQVIKTTDDGWAHLWRGVLRPGPYIRVTVRDTGAGMDRAIMEKIFDPFFTTKPKGAGTGLGLPSVASIVEAHGGALHIKSRANFGTVCAMLLPAGDGIAAITRAGREQERADAKPPEQLASEIAERKPALHARILVVDDEAYLADLMQITLSWAGYEVERYENSQAALERLQEDAEAFDLIITDQTMPGLTGVMLAERAAEIRPGLPVLLCTGFSAKSLERASLPQGVADILLKPFTPHDLVRMTKKVLGPASSC